LGKRTNIGKQKLFILHHQSLPLLQDQSLDPFYPLAEIGISIKA